MPDELYSLLVQNIGQQEKVVHLIPKLWQIVLEYMPDFKTLSDYMKPGTLSVDTSVSTPKLRVPRSTKAGDAKIADIISTISELVSLINTLERRLLRNRRT